MDQTKPQLVVKLGEYVGRVTHVGTHREVQFIFLAVTRSFGPNQRAISRLRRFNWIAIRSQLNRPVKDGQCGLVEAI